MRHAIWLSAIVIAAFGAVARPASAAAPVNDNYLASTQMVEADQSVKREFHEVLDTTAATVQADIFDPDSQGAPLGGGPLETTRCGQSTYGATVWYDLAPEIPGGAEILASGYDTVVTVYEYDVTTAAIKRVVTCSDQPGAGEDVLLPKLARGSHYTIQVGGAGVARGMLDFKFSFFGDRDGDGVLDETPDKCPTVRGISEAGGCPPVLHAAPRIRYRDAPGGIRLTAVSVSGLPFGARVEARCTRCGKAQVRVAKRPIIAMTQFVGRVVPTGARLEFFVTHARTTTGRFRYGAIGDHFRYPIRASGLGARVDRCLNPGSMTPRTRCP
jgi:hypothetical protein